MNPENNKPKVPYKKGWVCLMPVIGFYVGFLLIIQGIFKYKDKKLILIGLFGIIFTPLILYSFGMYERYSGLDKKGWEDFSKKNMKELVIQIETYKIKHGEYSDSLEEIEKQDYRAIIYDPVQMNKKRKCIIYNYKKIGDKYILFSSGEDGLPYTSDDLFPPLQIPENSKFNLIKPQNSN